MKQLVIGSQAVINVITENGFKEIISPHEGYVVLKNKKCYVKGETYFYINSSEMLIVRDMRFFLFREGITSMTFFKNIMNSLPTKFWRDLR